MRKSEKACFSVPKKLANDFRNVAHWKGARQSACMNRIMRRYVENFKADPSNKKFVVNGEIKQRPGNN
jgi:hypothetical protein